MNDFVFTENAFTQDNEIIYLKVGKTYWNLGRFFKNVNNTTVLHIYQDYENLQRIYTDIGTGNICSINNEKLKLLKKEWAKVDLTRHRMIACIFDFRKNKKYPPKGVK